MTKPFGEEIVLTAVERAIAQSRKVLEERESHKGLELRYASLTKREREVLLLVVTGLLNKQVAYELGISEITVKAHRGRVMEKMKAGSFAELVKMTARLGLDAVSER
jgi:FixJ family two-component response regulator